MTATELCASALADRFLDVFGRRPTVISRAPGRVNLLGEHTDYNGLPVLPMAIGRAVLVAGAPRDDRRVRVANADKVFPRREYELRASIEPFPAGDWGNYHKAAAQDLASLFGAEELYGGDFLVDGDVPPGAGLSSSAALVVASALALLAVNDRNISPIELAGRMAVAERYVGTMSGGMDQAVCLLGEAGCALRVDFDPLRVRKVPMGNGCAVVVCDSLVKAEKSGPARRAYNRRVAECRLACRILERALGARLPCSLESFGDLMRLFPECPLSEFVRVLEDVLPAGPLSLEEIARLAGSTPERIVTEAGPTMAGEEAYPLLQRARHVLTEAERVCRGEAALAAEDWSVFGALMDASHASCRDDYEVSCGELEDLVSVAKNAGAIGARLTGAGFGGCTVNLVPAVRLSLFREFVEREYYHDRPAAQAREHCFVFAPSAGASVVRL
jgi:N-acetylgalactosamine kinase